jgi:hypothetical protein
MAAAGNKSALNAAVKCLASRCLLPQLRRRYDRRKVLPGVGKEVGEGGGSEQRSGRLDKPKAAKNVGREISRPFF